MWLRNKSSLNYLKIVTNRKTYKFILFLTNMTEYTSREEFTLEDLTDFYAINGIEYRKGIYQVDLSKSLLPSGTQDEHAQRRLKALKSNDFYTPDYPLFHAVINTLHQNREGVFREQIEQARVFLADLVNEGWLMSLTRIKYQPNGNDIVIHNYNQDEQYEIPVSFVSPDGYITEKFFDVVCCPNKLSI